MSKRASLELCRKDWSNTSRMCLIVKNMTILEISKDLSLENHFQSVVKDLKITKQSLEGCLKNIASMLLKDSTNTGCVVSLLLFSMELDSYHSIHSSSWYTRDMLVETLYDIFSNPSKQKDSNLFRICSFISFVCLTMLIWNI